MQLTALAGRSRRLGMAGVLAAVACWAGGLGAGPATGVISAAAASPSSVGGQAVTAQTAVAGSGPDITPADQGGPTLTTPRHQFVKPAGAAAAESGGSSVSRVQANSGNRIGVFENKNFPGARSANEGGSPTPPDPTGAVGPTRYMEAVNNIYLVYDRSTGVELNRAPSDYFMRRSGLQRSVSDPQIQWDPRQNRWYYTAISYLSGANCPPTWPVGNVCRNEVDFGWSKSGDPTDLSGGWCNFLFRYGTDVNDPNYLRYIFDYPKIAEDDTWLHVSATIFDESDPNQPEITTTVFSFAKPASGSAACPPSVGGFEFGTAASPLRNPSDSTLTGTIIPANTYSTTPGATTYMVAAHDPTLTPLPIPQNMVLMMHVTGTPSSPPPGPQLVVDGEITIPTYNVPPEAVQPADAGGGLVGYHLDTLDARFEQASAAPDPSQGGSMGVWVAHSVSNGAAVSSNQATLRWYEFLPPVSAGMPVRIAQQGSITGGANTYAWNAGISPTTLGNEAGIQFSYVDATGATPSPPSIRAASRDGGTPAGQFANFITLANSTDVDVDYSCGRPAGGGVTPCRWGDYAALYWDPNNAHVLWGSNQWITTRYQRVSDGRWLAHWATSNFALTTAASGSTSAGPYQPVAPYRVLDTRDGTGGFGTLGANTSISVQVAGTGGTGGVPATGVGAVAVNVTAVNGSQTSYLTVYPSGPASRPLASTVNFTAGQQIANLTEVPVGSDGKVTIYNSQGTVDVLLDVQGYTLNAIQANTKGLYKALASPLRILDTRTGTPFGTVAANTSVTLTVPLPDSRSNAVVLNVTAVNSAAAGYLAVYPAGTTLPTVSNVNFPAGKNVPNRVMAQLGTAANAGKISVYNGSTAPVDVVVDMSGWFTDGTDPGATGGLFHALVPSRVLDTRAGSAVGPYSTPFTAGTFRWVQIAGMGGVPVNGASSVVGNLTAVNATAGTFLTAFPSSEARPNASDLNPGPGDTVANMIVTRLGGGDQAINVYNDQGSVDVIVDVTGYYG